MNKKIIFSIAAAVALLASTPGMNKAEAATPVSVQSKVYVYQTGNLNQDQMNSILKKYLNGNLSFAQYTKNVQELTNGKSTTTKVKQPTETVKQPTETVKQPTETVKQPAQKPAQKTVQQPTQKAVEQKQTTAPASSQVSAFEQQVLDLTNQERAKIGVPALNLDVELSKVAREKSRDMQAKGYFDHNSPTYGSPFDMMKKFGVSYRTAGENIAMGQQSPQEVVTAWMNSEGHRKNILNANYTHIGIGHVAQGNYWTQMFIGK
jgi:uncharacterized YkwD family protein